MNTYCVHPLINAQVERLLGGDITRLLDEGQAQEISVNADGRIRIDDGGPWKYLIDADPLPPAFAETAIRLIAALNHIWIDPDAPIAQGGARVLNKTASVDRHRWPLTRTEA